MEIEMIRVEGSFTTVIPVHDSSNPLAHIVELLTRQAEEIACLRQEVHQMKLLLGTTNTSVRVDERQDVGRDTGDPAKMDTLSQLLQQTEQSEHSYGNGKYSEPDHEPDNTKLQAHEKPSGEIDPREQPELYVKWLGDRTDLTLSEQMSKRVAVRLIANKKVAEDDEKFAREVAERKKARDSRRKQRQSRTMEAAEPEPEPEPKKSQSSLQQDAAPEQGCLVCFKQSGGTSNCSGFSPNVFQVKRCRNCPHSKNAHVLAEEALAVKSKERDQQKSKNVGGSTEEEKAERARRAQERLKKLKEKSRVESSDNMEQLRSSQSEREQRSKAAQLRLKKLQEVTAAQAALYCGACGTKQRDVTALFCEACGTHMPPATPRD